MHKQLLKAVLAGGFLFATGMMAQASDVTLTLAHFLSPKSATHTKFLAPWAKRIEAQSKGSIKVKIFPSMTMGGKPPELYRQLRDGAADMVWTVTGYTPGVFPRSEVFELPTVHQGSAEATNRAIQDSFSLLADDFKGIKPILVHVHAGNALHLVKGCIDKVEDLKGLKLRTPTRTGSWMIKSWGAEPVGMPVPALPQALSKKIVDGALIPYEVMPPLKAHELTKCSISIAGNKRFGTAVFLFAMNKERYDSLSPEHKAIIDANSGSAIARETGKVWDDNEALGKKLQKHTGSPVINLATAPSTVFDELGKTVVERWIKEADSRGFDGRKLVQSARDAIAKHSK